MAAPTTPVRRLANALMKTAINRAGTRPRPRTVKPNTTSAATSKAPANQGVGPTGLADGAVIPLKTMIAPRTVRIPARTNGKKPGPMRVAEPIS